MPEDKDEISLKEIIDKIKGCWRYLVLRWKIIFIVSLIGGGMGFFYSLYKKPTYTGTLIFVLSNDNKAGGGLANLAGQFGFDMNGLSGSNGAFDGENIIELLRSKRIIKGALFKEVPEYKQSLINIIGQNTNFYKAWMKKPELRPFLPLPSNVNQLTPLQDSLVNIIYKFCVNEYLSISKPDKKLSFYQVSTISPEETISVHLTKNVVEEAAKMYIDTKTKTARQNLQMLQHEVDSIRNRLSGVIYSTASTVDATYNLNPALQTQRASVQGNQIQLQASAAAYGEVLKNLEIAKITLQKETPLYQIIDEPTYPLTRAKTSKLYGIILGGILGFLLITTSMIAGVIYKKVIA